MAEDGVKAATHLEKARQLNKEALASIRASVATLRTSPVRQSLQTSIERLIADFRSNTNIEIVLKDTPSKELAQAIRSIDRGYTQMGPGLFAKAMTNHLDQAENSELNSTPAELA